MGKRSSAAKALLAAVAVLSLAAPAGASAALTAAEKTAIQKLGSDAYTFGYAPVYMDHTVKRFPANTLLNVQYLATDATRAVVNPNSDTLYTISVLDLGTDPVIVSTPATGSRYFALEVLDSYTNVTGYIPCLNGKASTTATCPTKSVGTTAGSYALVGPKWKNSGSTKLKKTVKKVIRAATPRVWVIGRTLVDGEADLPAAKAVQDAITMQRNSKVTANQFLSRVNLTTPNKLPDPAPVEPTAGFFKELGVVTKAQPPLSADSSLMTKLRARGIGPNLDPAKTQTAEVMAELVKGAQAADAAIRSGVEAGSAASRAKRNGWVLFDGVGSYGKDYATRAVIAKFGLGANNPNEAIYPAAVTDFSGNALDGSTAPAYRVHFEPGQLPPNTGGFWSISMYGDDMYFIPNPIDRFAIGNRTAGLNYNPDGSLDLYLSSSRTLMQALGFESNWLPAPAGKFSLVMRIYRPTAAVLNDTWKYPKITRVNIDP